MFAMCIIGLAAGGGCAKIRKWLVVGAEGEWAGGRGGEQASQREE